MESSLTDEELIRRLNLVIKRLGFVPDESFLRQVPYWSALVDRISERYPGNEEAFDYFVDHHIPKGQIRTEEVVIPSLEQMLVGANIARRRRVLELSKPGTRKTIASLCAIPIIEDGPLHEANPDQDRLRTFITCPGYIIPVWIREIGKLFPSPDITVITSENRDAAIRRAASSEGNFVIVGYNMTFRPTFLGPGNNTNGEREDHSERYFNMMSEVSSSSAAYAKLAGFIPKDGIEKLRRRNLSLPELLEEILKAEDLSAENRETERVFDSLRKEVFKPGTAYYCIMDEFHNIVSENSKRAEAIGEIARGSTWLNLLSGTGIGKTPEGLAFAANLMGFVESPRDFVRWISGKHTVGKVRAFLNQYAIHPVRKLKDIDSKVRDPIIENKVYELTDAETDLFTALLDSERFEGKERYHLFRSLISNPHKILPERFEGFKTGDNPLYERVVSFFEDNPGLEDRVRQSVQSRIQFTRGLVQELKSHGEKCIIACEFQTEVTSALEEALNDLGVRRVDGKSTDSGAVEILLTSKELAFLRRAARRDGGDLFIGHEKYRSDLSARARELFALKPHEIYGLSSRDVVISEFATNPDITALVSTRVLREGVELKEARYIIKFEDTTVPSHDEQFNGRVIRSGQHQQTFIWNVRSPILEALEGYIAWKRESRQQEIDAIHKAHNGQLEDNMRQWAEGESPEDQLKAIFGKLKGFSGIRTILSAHFNRLEGTGSEAYNQSLLMGNNAMFIARLYNKNWESTYSGNLACLLRDIIKNIEHSTESSLERILDAASGPLALARTIRRGVTSVDMNGYQIGYGVDFCEREGISGNKVFLGDITDLENLVSFDKREKEVFDRNTKYEEKFRMENHSQDAVVASLVLDLLDRQGRYKFITEAHRVLVDQGYLIVALPSKRVDESCRGDFISDIEKMGFANVRAYTGEYRGYSYGEREARIEKIDPYIIVMQKKQEGEPAISCPELRLRPSIKVVEGRLKDQAKKDRNNYGENPVSADYFVRVEDGFNPRSDQPKYNQPYSRQASIIGISGDPRAVNDVLVDIARIIKEIPGRENQNGS